MPTYQYECEGCGHEFEEFQSMSEPALEKCPACKKKKLRRLFGTGAAILFKGSGFYETDYRSESYKNAAKAEQDAGKGKSATDGTSGTNGTAKSDSAGSGKKSGSKSSKPTPKASDD